MKLESNHLLHLRKVFTYLESKGFITQRNNTISLGFLGHQLKQNLTAEWRRSVQKSESFHMIPGHLPYKLNDIFSFYPTVSKLLKGREPFGYFHTSLNENNLTHSVRNNSFLEKWDQSELTGLQVLFFCSRKKCNRWFDHWVRERLLWWREFSGTPSNFQFNDLETGSNNQEIQIYFNLNEKQIPIEVIHTFEGSSLEKITTQSLNSNLNVINCETIAENIALSLLVDSYKEKSNNTVLELNHRITPFKVAIAIAESEDFEVTKKLRGLASFIHNDLLQVDIFSFPNPNLLLQEVTLGQQLLRDPQ